MRSGKSTLKGACVLVAMSIVLTVVLFSGASGAPLSNVFLVSTDSFGLIGNEASQAADVSADGRYVVFHSLANNLVPDDTNDTFDIFLKDMETQHLRVVSHSLGGAGPSNSLSVDPSISADGRYVFFTSFADDLVEGDTNNEADTFLWDSTTQVHVRVSETWDGFDGNGPSGGGAISGDGNWAVFTSYASNLVPEDTNFRADVFVRNLQTWEIYRVTPVDGEPNGNSYDPTISFDGSRIVFPSTASNLVPVEPWSGYEDVYLYDAASGEISYIARNTEGGPGDAASSFPVISQNGRYVAFQSFADNLSPVDTNGFSNAYLLDTLTDELVLVSIDQFGGGANNNSGLHGIAVNDLGNVVFESRATDLIPNLMSAASRLYIYKDGYVVLLVDGDGTERTAYPEFTSQFSVVFESLVSDLVAGDDNGTWDVFLLDIVEEPQPTETATSTATVSPTPTTTSTPSPPIVFAVYLPIVVTSE